MLSYAQQEVQLQVLDFNGQPLEDVELLDVNGNLIQISSTSGELLIADQGADTINYYLFSIYGAVPWTLIPNSERVQELRWPSPAMLKPISVQALRQQSYARSSTTYTQEDFEQKARDQDIPFLLQNNIGIVSTSDAGAGIGYTSMRLRGTDQTRINVTINGVPLNDGESQQVYWVDLPDLSQNIESLQVQRGVGFSTNGAASFGGSVNINTHKIKDGSGGFFQQNFGSFRTHKTSFGLHHTDQENKFAVEGRYSILKSDGYIDRASSQLRSAYVTATKWFDRSSLRYTLIDGHERTYQAWYGIDSAQLATDRTYNPAGTEKPGAPYADQVDDYRQTHHQLHWALELNNNWQFGVTGFYTKGKGYYEEYKASESFADYHMPPLMLGDSIVASSDIVRRKWLSNDFYGAQGRMSFVLNSDFSANTGIGYARYDGAHFGRVIWAAQSSVPKDFEYYRNDAHKINWNAYAQAIVTPGEAWRFLLDLQYRAVDYQLEGRDGLPQEDDFQFFQPKASIAFNPKSKNYSFSLYSGLAYKEPNRNDYLERASNQAPLPERLWDTELGLSWKKENVKLETNVFYMQYKDQLVLNGQLNEVGEYARINVPHSYRLGLEASLNWQLNPYLQGTAKLSWSENKIKDFYNYLDSYDSNFNYLGQEVSYKESSTIAFSPDFIVQAGLRYARTYGKINLASELNFKYVSEQYLANEQATALTLPGFNFTNFSIILSYPMKEALVLKTYVSCVNLFDQTYVNNGWSYSYLVDGARQYIRGYYPQAGRQFYAGIKFEF